MSLTSHLADVDSPVTNFMLDYFPRAEDYVEDYEIRLRRLPTIRPEGWVPWNIIGRAIDYRLRYYFAVTPWDEFAAYKGQWRHLSNIHGGDLDIRPDSTFLWQRRKDVVYWYEKESKRQVASFNKDGSSDGLATYWDMFNLLSSQIFAGEEFEGGEQFQPVSGAHLLHPPYDGFFTSLGDLTERVQPAKTRLALPEEDEINLHCFILGLLETAYRTGKQDRMLSAAKPQDLSALFSIVKQDWINDMRNLSWAFYDRYGSRLLGLPADLNPEFAYSHIVQGADADLIVNGMLVDIKTTVNPRLAEVWIWQLLGYVLLDRFDQHKIRHIGLYMARQGRLVWWELDEIIKGVSGKNQSVEELRELFFENVLSVLK